MSALSSLCLPRVTMKFSYRLIALAILLSSLVVVYLTWGNDLLTWDDKTLRKKGLLSAGQLPSGFSSGQNSQTNTQKHVQPQPIHEPIQSTGRGQDECVFDEFEGAKTNVKTSQLLEEINVARKAEKPDIPEEGAPVPNTGPFKRPPLKIIVVPHSHNDPGWHKTVDGYFMDQTKPTLDNMVEKLTQYPKMTFVWAESVFLHMWWQDLDVLTKKTVKRLVKRGQLEVVVGSWVVPDEANPHYFSLVDQMIEGHQWLESSLGVKPQNTWSLDPFGYSSSLPYLYKRAGYDNMVILRVHKEVKALLEKQSALEFYWRQHWDLSATGTTDILTLMMPYKLYNIKYTCGPDHYICLGFDFRKIPGEYSEAHPEPVGPNNVAKLAGMLRAQYEKKASLFKHNVVLVPIGDDFRYDRKIEWDQQYGNYTKLFDYFNTHPELNITARFGTIHDYFAEVKNSIAEFDTTSEEFFPSLSGDFFPYTDENEDYWTGYYTSRPFDKVLGGELEVQLRAAEIVHSLALASGPQVYGDLARNWKMLSDARQALGLFQHHDAITGTARSYVVIDYENRLNIAISSVQDVFKSAIKQLLKDKAHGNSVVVLDMEPPATRKMTEPAKSKFVIPEVNGRNIILFNPIAQYREEVVRLTVSSYSVTVLNEENKPVVCQVNPVWISDSIASASEFEVVFTASLPPLGAMVYQILHVNNNSTMCNLATPTVYSSNGFHKSKQQKPFSIRLSQNRPKISLENHHMKVDFSPITGYLHSITSKDDLSVQTSIQFLLYKTMRSGAYIFKPDGRATKTTDFVDEPLIRVIKGPVVSEVHVIQPLVNHTVRLWHSSLPQAQALEINNLVNIMNVDNAEMIMRITTNFINEGGVFYTDLNGLQIMRRHAFPNFPMEANYYPMTSFVYLEDEARRLSLISSQPLGVSCQSAGSLEVMMDRRLRFDDGRGLGEGIMDNKITPSRFYLLLEKPQSPLSEKKVEFRLQRDVSFPSLLAHTLAHRLRYYPIAAAVRLGAENLNLQFEPLSVPLPCNTHLVNLRALGSPPNTMTQKYNQSAEAALILHRVGTDCAFPSSGCPLQDAVLSSHSSYPNLSTLFSKDVAKVLEVKETTLSLMHDKRGVPPQESLKLDPMHLYTYRMKFT